MRFPHKEKNSGPNPLVGTCGNGEMVSRDPHKVIIARFEDESRYYWGAAWYALMNVGYIGLC
jgi:hypothetical protein